MNDILQKIMGVTIIIFMVGNLLEVGLPQVELSEFKLGPRFSGEPNGASKLDWSVFTQKMSEKARRDRKES